MDNRERQENKLLDIDKNAQIQVMVNRPESNEIEIDLARVFHRMKLQWRIFAWVLVLCLVAGACLPLLMAQFNQKPLTVKSVVTLRDIPDPSQIASSNELEDIPDIPELDLSQITSSYVLQNALDGLALSQPVSLAALRGNLTVERILTEESRREQEVAASMIEDKNAGAYSAVRDLELTYENTIVVSLTNGFGEDNNLVFLKDDELRLVLDRVLSAYNDYLVLTYNTIKLPDDEIIAIDTAVSDIPDSVDQLRSAVQNLYNFCDEMPPEVIEYRSWRTGRSLTDWMETLNTVRNVNVGYLNSYVYTNNIVRDINAIITNYQYQRRNRQTQLDVVNENIETLKSLLNEYQNDQIAVMLQESDASKSVKSTTDYYNSLVTQQAENYATADELETAIAELEDKIASLSADRPATQAEYLEEAEQELSVAVRVSHAVYEAIRSHMEEILQQPMYTTYAEHSAALGKKESVIKSAMKNMMMGMGIGAVLALGLWFLSALAPEFSMDRDAADPRKRRRVYAERGEEGTER